MDTLMKADVFFFITSIAIVVLSVLFAVVLFYLIHILRDVREMVSLAKEELEQGIKSTKDFVEAIKSGAAITGILHFIGRKIHDSFTGRTQAARKKRATKKKRTQE